MISHKTLSLPVLKWENVNIVPRTLSVYLFLFFCFFLSFLLRWRPAGWKYNSVSEEWYKIIRFKIEVAILGTGLALDLMVTRWLRITNTPRYLTTEPRRQEQRLILKGNRNLEGDDGSFFLFFFFFFFFLRIGTKHDLPLSSKEYQPQKI